MSYEPHAYITKIIFEVIMIRCRDCPNRWIDANVGSERGMRVDVSTINGRVLSPKADDPPHASRIRGQDHYWVVRDWFN
jgi:hypothetical protein